MPTKINIVLLTDCLADLAGGAEKQIYELAKRLDKSKYNVFVVSLDCWGQAPKDVIESTGSSLQVFRVVRVYGLSGLVQGLKFKKFLIDNQVDAMVTYHFSSDMWGTFWGHQAGVKSIYSNRRDMGFWRNGMHINAYKCMNQWVKKIIVVSNSIKDLVVKEEGYSEDKIEVVYNGVDLPQFGPEVRVNYRHALMIKDDETAIMHVANLKPVKGHPYLIEAFARVVDQFPKTKLFLIGKDEYQKHIQTLVKQFHLDDKVFFLGKREDVSKVLTASDICVLPSLSEGMSNAILEYMSAGKPVIATNVGGNPELVRQNFNGIIVEPKSADQLNDALQSLLANEQLRINFGQNGRHLAHSEFSMEAMVKKYDNLLGGQPS